MKPTRFVLMLAALAAVTACDGVGFDAKVDQPAFPGGGPTVLFDEGHHNHHTLTGTYRPFARLLRSDGFEVEALDGPVTREALSRGRILAIVTAQSDTETNAEPAFAPAEIAAIVGWVRDGGSLLLVSEHYPFANAVEGLANALGLEVAKGMTFDAGHHRQGTGDDSRLIFSRANGLLGPHPVTDGRNPRERVELVETFTGDALRPRGATIRPLMRLADSAENRRGVPAIRRRGGDTVVEVQFRDPTPARGWVQGAAFELGRGRVVALAEAAMLTAQEVDGRPVGMNAPGNDNRQFVLNAMRWLGRAY